MTTLYSTLDDKGLSHVARRPKSWAYRVVRDELAAVAVKLGIASNLGQGRAAARRALVKFAAR